MASAVRFETLQTRDFGQAVFDGAQNMGEPAFPLTGTAQFGFEQVSTRLC